jgi:hypothetical protein
MVFHEGYYLSFFLSPEISISHFERTSFICGGGGKE